jgi:hypothetical protein
MSLFVTDGHLLLGQCRLVKLPEQGLSPVKDLNQIDRLLVVIVLVPHELKGSLHAAPVGLQGRRRKKIVQSVALKRAKVLGNQSRRGLMASQKGQKQRYLSNVRKDMVLTLDYAVELLPKKMMDRDGVRSAPRKDIEFMSNSQKSPVLPRLAFAFPSP